MMQSLKPRKLLHALSLTLTALLIANSGYSLPDDRQQPIKIDADRAVHNDKTGVTEFIGNATLNQGSMVIKADNITISHSDSGIKDIVALGSPATFVQQPNADQSPVNAQAKRIEYDISKESIKLLHNAKIDKDGSVFTSERIDYDINQATTESEGGVEIIILPGQQ